VIGASTEAGARSWSARASLAAAVLELDFDEREEERILAAPQQGPVDPARRSRRSRLGAEPALPLEEAEQEIAFDEGADVALEQGVPRRADEQRRRGRA